MPRLCAAGSLVVSMLLMGNGYADPVEYRSETRKYNVAHGRVVFENHCLRCHESGRKGAPVFGDLEDWRERLDQPLDDLIRHAIEGHGDMPPRGDQQISDQDVSAAVAFVVERTRRLMFDLDALPPPAAGPRAAPAPTAGGELSDDAVAHMFMLLYGKDRWK